MFYAKMCFMQKCVLCIYFMLNGSWEGGKKLEGRIFLSKNLLGLGYKKQTTSLGLMKYNSPQWKITHLNANQLNFF